MYNQAPPMAPLHHPVLSDMKSLMNTAEQWGPLTLAREAISKVPIVAATEVAASQVDAYGMFVTVVCSLVTLIYVCENTIYQSIVMYIMTVILFIPEQLKPSPS